MTSVSITPQSLKAKRKALNEAKTKQSDAQQELNKQDKAWQKWAVRKKGEPPARAAKTYFDDVKTAKDEVDKAQTEYEDELQKLIHAKSELDRVKDEVKTSTGGEWKWYKNKPLGRDAYIMYFVKKIIFDGQTWKAVGHIHSQSFGAAPNDADKFAYSANDKADLIAPKTIFQFGVTPKMEGLGSKIKTQIGDFNAQVATHNTWKDRDDGPNDDNYAKYVNEMFNMYDDDFVYSDSYGLQNGYGSYKAVNNRYYADNVNHIGYSGDNASFTSIELAILMFSGLILVILLCCVCFVVGAGIGYWTHKKVRDKFKTELNDQV
eukprot:351855_1